MKSNKGFTLVELFATIAIITISLVVGVPAIQTTIHSTRLSTQTNRFIGLLNIARSEAVKRSVNVVICPANTATSACVEDWNDTVNNSIIAFRDDNKNADIDSTEKVTNVLTGFNKGNTITVSGLTIPGFLGFDSMGSPINPTNGTATFTLCNSAIHKRSIITITRTGRVSSANPRGTDLSC